MKKLFILLVCLLPVLAQAQMETSVAGFIPLSGSGRIVYNFNPGWRFHRGDIKGAEAVRFDDTSWQVVFCSAYCGTDACRGKRLP